MSPRTLHDKRGIPRISCRISAGTVVRNNPVNLVITDLSEKGIKVESTTKLKINTMLPISVVGSRGTLSEARFERNTITVKVTWCRRNRFGSLFNAGLAFTDSPEELKDSWVTYVLDKFYLTTEPVFTQRENLRIYAEVPVSCTLDGNRTITGKIENISMGGLLIHCREKIPEDTLLDMTIGAYKNIRAFTVNGKVLRSSMTEGDWLTAVTIEKAGNKETHSLKKLILTAMHEEIF